MVAEEKIVALKGRAKEEEEEMKEKDTAGRLIDALQFPNPTCRDKILSRQVRGPTLIAEGSLLS